MQAKTINLIYKIMKNINLKLIVAAVLVLIASCNQPETVVTNIVHPDGSVTRKIEVKNLENKFDISGLQVPFDNSWFITDTLELNKNGDTVWVRRAEKLFKNVDEINRDYKTDSSYNKIAARSTKFGKRFRWFHTEYKFAEKIDKRMEYGYPVKEFLNEEELLYFYSPESIINEKQNGPDSLKYKALRDSVTRKTDLWMIKCAVSEWIGDFAKLIEKIPGNDITFESLKSRENEYAGYLNNVVDDFDSLWENGYILREFIGEANSRKYMAEADSAMTLALDELLPRFQDYSVRIAMPGKVTGSNGFFDTKDVLYWPVSGDYFASEDYEMWAESRKPNRWAWIASGVFVLFVFTGILSTKKGKG